MTIRITPLADDRVREPLLLAGMAAASVVFARGTRRGVSWNWAGRP